MISLSLAMVVGVAPALVAWWRLEAAGWWISQIPLVTSESKGQKPKLVPLSWPPRRSPSLSDCLASSSDEESARSVACQIRPKIVSNLNLLIS